MKSQDVKESHFEAIKILTDLEGNLSTCHYFAISFDGFGRSKRGLRTVCSTLKTRYILCQIFLNGMKKSCTNLPHPRVRSHSAI